VPIAALSYPSCGAPFGLRGGVIWIPGGCMAEAPPDVNEERWGRRCAMSMSIPEPGTMLLRTLAVQLTSAS
jgi:hypothetical protein